MAKRKFIDKKGVEREATNANLSTSALRRFKVAMANRGIDRIQDALDEAIELWAAKAIPPGKPLEPVLTGKDFTSKSKTTGTISHVSSELTDEETGYLRICLRILRSVFGRAIIENLKAFAMGLDAREALGMRSSGVAPIAHAEPSRPGIDDGIATGERQADEIEQSGNEAFQDAEELRRLGKADQRDRGRDRKRRG